MADIPESSVGSKLREAGRHSIVYGLGSVVQSAIGFLLIPILTGSLSKDAYGVYSLILMASSIASAVFYLGMTSALPRSYFDYESMEDRRAVFTTAFLILAIGAAAQSSLGFWGSGLISSVLFHSDRYAGPVAWAFFGSAIAFINQFFFAYLRFLRKSVSSVVFSLLSLVGGIGLTLLLLNRTPGNLASPFEAIALSQLAITTIFVAKFGKQAFTFQLKKQEVAILIPFGLMAVVASFANMLLDWADRLVIERYVSIADVGVYSAGYKLGSLIIVVMILPFAQIWSPMMMEYRTHTNIKELFTRGLSYFVLLGTVILLGASLFIGDMLPILVRSGTNHQLVSVVVMVMVGIFAYGTINIVSAGLFYERKLSNLVYVYYAFAAFKFGANVLVIPVFGIVGAAFITMVTYLLMPTAIYLFARQYFSFPIEWKRLGMLSAICALPLVYGVLFWSSFPIWWPVRMIWFAGSCLLIYFTCLSIDEKLQFRKALQICKIKLAG